MNGILLTDLPLRNIRNQTPLETAKNPPAIKKNESSESLAPYLLNYCPNILETTAAIVYYFKSVLEPPAPLTAIYEKHLNLAETIDEQLQYFIEYFYPVKRFLKDGHMFKESEIIATDIFAYLIAVCNDLLQKEIDAESEKNPENLRHMLTALKLIRIYSRVDRVVSQCGVACLEMLRKMPRSFPLPSILDADRWASIANLGYSSSSQAHILESGFIPEILNELQQAPRNNSVQIELYAIINNFASNAQCGKEVAQKGGTTFLMDSMSKQLDTLDFAGKSTKLRRNDDEMMIQGMMALTALGVHSPLLDKSRFCFLLDRILLKFGFQNSNLVMGVCRAIGFLTFAESFDQSIQQVMLSILLRCMEYWAAEISLQKCICFALAHLLFKRTGNAVPGPGGDLANESPALNTTEGLAWANNIKKVCQLVLKATLTFDGDIALQTTAMFCISSLSMHGHNIKKYLCDINAPLVIMHSMEAQTASVSKTRIERLRASAQKTAAKPFTEPPIDSAVVVDSPRTISSASKLERAHDFAPGASTSAADTQTDNPVLPAQNLQRSESRGAGINVANQNNNAEEDIENIGPQQQNPLLLQIFASSALLNLSESPECHTTILKSGALHWVHNALKLVHKERDLAFMLYYLFMRLTPSMSRRICLHYEREVPSLKALCRKVIASSIVRQWNTLKHETQQKYLTRAAERKYQSHYMLNKRGSGSAESGSKKSSSSLIAKLQDWIPFPSLNSGENSKRSNSAQVPPLFDDRNTEKFASVPNQQSFASFLVDSETEADADTDSQFLLKEAPIVTRRYFIREKLEKLDLSDRLRAELGDFVVCGACGHNACIESDMRLYEVSTGNQLATGLLDRIIGEEANNRDNITESNLELDEFESDVSSENSSRVNSNANLSRNLSNLNFSEDIDTARSSVDGDSQQGVPSIFKSRNGESLSLLSIKSDDDTSDSRVLRLSFTETRYLSTNEDQDEDSLGNLVDSSAFKNRVRWLKKLESIPFYSKELPLASFLPPTLSDAEPMLTKSERKPSINGDSQTMHGFMVCSSFCADRVQRLNGPSNSWAKVAITGKLPLVASRRAV